jgi:hypothetical protein
MENKERSEVKEEGKTEKTGKIRENRGENK